MDELSSKDPDKILKFIQSTEEQTRSGRFRIFFGMAAGVGKTYAMLQSAQRLKSEGVDVVIGYIETHGRRETVDLLAGLEEVPRKKISYKNVIVEEMDIDEIIKRNPQVVLVDELAHTNTPGMRHPKRYMDVLEILQHGISVFSTLNVQHLESQADLAFKITGVPVRETLPDSVLDRADEIKLMDLMPEELLKRLEEGKVYTEDKVALALGNFFQKENLTALRELALHFTAKKVDHELEEYRKYSRNLSQMNEKLMVCISSSPDSAFIIRWTRKIAFNMKAEWIVLYVDTGKTRAAGDDEYLHANLELARRLGAETIVTADQSVVNGILRMAEERNVTQLVMGRSPESQNRFRLKTNLMETLLKASPDLHISIISSNPESEKKIPKRSWRFSTNISLNVKEYLITLISILSITFTGTLLRNIIGYRSVSFFYLFLVLTLSLFFSRGPVILSAVLSAIFLNFFFIEPLYTFRVEKFEDLLLLVTYLVIALVTSRITAKMKNNERILRKREKRLWSLYDLSQRLPTATNLNDIVALAVTHIQNFFGVKVFLILAERGDSESLARLELTSHTLSGYIASEKDMAVASWVFQNQKQAGKFTDTLPLSDSLFYPLMAPGGVMGVLGIQTETRLTLGQDALLKTFATQIALAIERFNLTIENQKSISLRESDRLYKILFNLISHELKTPLTILNTACENLQNEKLFSRPETRKELINEIARGSRRLTRLVENLLDMSRLETGLLTLNMAQIEVYDLINSVIKEISIETERHFFDVKISDNLPPIHIDFILMQRCLMNLIVNAVQATPENKTIRIEAGTQNNHVEIKVADEGSGISETDLPYIFEKFHRADPGEKTISKGGMGLGLSIVKGVVEAHKGKIIVQSSQLPPSGTTFTITLPVHKNE